MFRVKISDNAPFSLQLFAFVHVPPIVSVLLTYSLKINSLLFRPTLYISPTTRFHNVWLDLAACQLPWIRIHIIAGSTRESRVDWRNSWCAQPVIIAHYAPRDSPRGHVTGSDVRERKMAAAAATNEWTVDTERPSAVTYTLARKVYSTFFWACDDHETSAARTHK